MAVQVPQWLAGRRPFGPRSASRLNPIRHTQALACQAYRNVCVVAWQVERHPYRVRHGPTFAWPARDLHPALSSTWNRCRRSPAAGGLICLGQTGHRPCVVGRCGGIGMCSPHAYRALIGPATPAVSLSVASPQAGRRAGGGGYPPLCSGPSHIRLSGLSPHCGLRSSARSAKPGSVAFRRVLFPSWSVSRSWVARRRTGS